MMASTRIMARTASVALLSLLLLASSAKAECAWVLWDRDPIPVARGVSETRWVVVSGYESRSECEVNRRGLKNTLESAMKEYDKRTGASASEPYVAIPICLPDTIDPRGPKR